ncbi:MAG: hypothetical protein RJA36_1806 [Pseudomonadota bacterium]|jgi:hypothetical protein
MKKSVLLAAALALPALGAGVAHANDTAAGTEPAWVSDARSVAAAIPPKLLQTLTAAIQQSGPAEAIGICRTEAPRMARAASEQTGWQIRRVSLRNRNPKAVPDDWERQTLESFERSQASGVDASQLERWDSVTENGQSVRRYMRALPTQALCLQCHGKAEDLGAGVAQRLGQLYPDDRGTGYSVGQIRGAMTLRQAVR